MQAEVTISERFRCGYIYYREGKNEIIFDWEFGGGGVIAVISGTNAQGWDARYPWAAGRQAEICDLVAKEVIRQKARTSNFKIDLESGTITIL
jgi:hypothetical protein